MLSTCTHKEESELEMGCLGGRILCKALLKPSFNVSTMNKSTRVTKGILYFSRYICCSSMEPNTLPLTRQWSVQRSSRCRKAALPSARRSHRWSFRHAEPASSCTISSGSSGTLVLTVLEVGLMVLMTCISSSRPV